MAGGPDYDWVTSRIALGGEINSIYDVRALAADGVTHILNVRTTQDEVPYVMKVGLQYASNPTRDRDTKEKPPGWFKSSMDVILGALQDPDAKIYVHCERGENRGPSTVYFFLRALGLSKDMSTGLITDARKQAKGAMRYNDDAERALKDLGFK